MKFFTGWGEASHLKIDVDLESETFYEGEGVNISYCAKKVTFKIYIKF